MTDDDLAPVPAIAALSAFFLTIIAGIGMGFLVSAAVVEEGFSTRYAVMTERPMNFVTSTFNWLIFAMFAAAAFIAAAAAWGRIERRTRPLADPAGPATEGCAAGAHERRRRILERHPAGLFLPNP